MTVFFKKIQRESATQKPKKSVFHQKNHPFRVASNRHGSRNLIPNEGATYPEPTESLIATLNKTSRWSDQQQSQRYCL